MTRSARWIWSKGQIAAALLLGVSCRAPAGPLTRPPAEVARGAATTSAAAVVPAPIEDVAAGRRHTCVIQGGEVRCWGHRAGECGETGEEHAIAGVPPARAIFAGDDRTCAIDRTGGVWCWDFGEQPVAVRQASGALNLGRTVEIAPGEAVCARDSDGGFGCWDREGAPFLGRKRPLVAESERVTALAIHPHLDAWMMVADGKPRFMGVGGQLHATDLPPLVDVAFADWEGCAVDVAGAVQCWETDLGVGRRYQLMNLPPLVDLVAGDFHFCGRTREDRLWCWGGGEDGQLGRGVEAMRADVAPGEVPLADVRKVSAGAAHTCALIGEGDVHCWGDNRRGQLGFGRFTREPRRWSVKPGGGGVGRIVAGLATCLLDGGTLRCVGSLHEQPQPRFETLPGATEVTVAAAARDSLCAARQDGRVVCWQRRGSEPPAPFVVPNVVDARDLAVSSRGGCAVGADRRVRCWGRDLFRWLGGDVEGGERDEFYRDAVHCHGPDPAEPECIYARLRPWAREALPAPYSDGAALLIPRIGDALAVAMGRAHACVLRERGVVTCWGGEVGDAPRRALQAELQGRTVRALVAPGSGVCALDERGEVVCEGFPAPPGLSGIVELSAGEEHVCARGGAGEVFCWGRNEFGQLGDGDCADRDDAVRVALPGPARSVAAGVRHACAGLEDGSLWCWGDERDGAMPIAPPRRIASPARRGDPPPREAVPSFAWAPLAPDDSFERTVDARLRRELGAGVQRDCYTLEWYRGRCDARADLDGDGLVDRVVTIRRGAGKRARRGLAILWGDGRAVEIGTRTPLRLRHAGAGGDDEGARAPARSVVGRRVGRVPPWSADPARRQAEPVRRGRRAAVAGRGRR